MSSTYQVLGAKLLGASKAGDVEEVQSLLERGADPGFRDGDGNTAAHFAATSEILDALIAAATLPPELEDYMQINDVHPSAQCWTCTTSDSLTADAIPLSMYGIPVVIPVQNQYPPRAPLSPPSDPYPEFLEPTAPVTDEMIEAIFDIYEEALGFYLLINGYLQIIVPDEFDYEQALSQRPRHFGGLEVSYITQSLIPTANQQTTPNPETAYTLPVPSQGGIGRTISAAHKEKLETRHRASIGVVTTSPWGNGRYLTIPTHLVTSVWMEHYKPGLLRRLFRSGQSVVPQDTSWLNDVQIFSSTGDQLGQLAETFDPRPGSFPRDFPYDISLVNITNENDNLFSSIKAPMPIGWLSHSGWDDIKYNTKELFLLSHVSMPGSEAKSIGLEDSQFQPVGEAIFKRQPKDNKKEGLVWTDFVSRALLFRTKDRNVQSGTAVCVRDDQKDGTKCAKVAGFVAFAQEVASPSKFEIGDETVYPWLQRGLVAFYGAFQVPEALRKHTIL